jgi:predicted hydrolase (HD superfamily)
VQREQAWALLTEFTKSESLLKHALAVEAAMRYYAGKFNAERELWGTTGL